MGSNPILAATPRRVHMAVTVGAYKGFAHVRVDEGDLAAL